MSITTLITHHFHRSLACALKYERMETQGDYTLMVNNCHRLKIREVTLPALSLNDRSK
jgi:hypothetical protein